MNKRCRAESRPDLEHNGYVDYEKYYDGEIKLARTEGINNRDISPYSLEKRGYIKTFRYDEAYFDDRMPVYQIRLWLK